MIGHTSGSRSNRPLPWNKTIAWSYGCVTPERAYYLHVRRKGQWENPHELEANEAWWGWTDDYNLLGAIAMIYNFVPEVKESVEILADRPITIRFEEIDADGQWNRAARVIQIQQRFTEERTSVLACIIAHELTHAAGDQDFSQDNRETIRRRFQEEVLAFTRHGHTWSWLHQGDEDSPLAKECHEISQQVGRGTIRDYVLTRTAYHKDIFGGSLDP